MARLAEIHAGEIAAVHEQAATEASSLREAAAVADAAQIEALHGRARAEGEAAALRGDLDRARGELDQAGTELPQAVAAAQADDRQPRAAPRRRAVRGPGHARADRARRFDCRRPVEPGAMRAPSSQPGFRPVIPRYPYPSPTQSRASQRP